MTLINRFSAPITIFQSVSSARMTFVIGGAGR